MCNELETTRNDRHISDDPIPKRLSGWTEENH
jgi:hypothetical protein